MQEHLKRQLAQATTMAHVEAALFELLVAQRLQHPRLGYVAGVITTDGPEHIPRNIQRLLDHTERLREQHNFPLFSAPDVFTNELYERVSAHTLTSAEFQKFWRTILERGYITDVFMTPRWEVSHGARDEHETAERLSIPIHYIS